MPKRGENIQRTESGAWKAQFKVKETVIKPDGTTATVWRGKARTFDTYDDARDFLAGVRLTARSGEVWRDKREVAVVTIKGICDAYTETATNANTRKTRGSYLRALVAFTGEDRPVTDLSAALLDAYAASLPSEGRSAGTRHRKVLEAEAAWTWARRRPDLYPGVPEPEKVTGKWGASVQPPPPVVRTASPTMDDVDLMLAQVRTGWKYGDLTRRVAILLRYTGWRISQAIGLRWSDVRLDYPATIPTTIRGVKTEIVAGPYFILRAGQRGMKSSKGRAIPIHPALAEEMAGWGVREGLVFDPGERAGATWEDGEAVRVALTTAWTASGVDPAKWSVSEAEKAAGDRAHGTPTHAIRSAVKVHLLRSGISDALADYYVGHTKGSTSGAYVPEAAPETSPYWPALVEAVVTIPPHASIKVRHLHPRWGT